MNKNEESTREKANLLISRQLRISITTAQHKVDNKTPKRKLSELQKKSRIMEQNHYYYYSHPLTNDESDLDCDLLQAYHVSPCRQNNLCFPNTKEKQDQSLKPLTYTNTLHQTTFNISESR